MFQDGKTLGLLFFSPLVDPGAANPLVSLFPPRRSCYNKQRQNTGQKLRESCTDSDLQLLGRTERTRQAEMAKSSSAEGPATLSCRRLGGRGCSLAPATPQSKELGGAFPRLLRNLPNQLPVLERQLWFLTSCRSSCPALEPWSAGLLLPERCHTRN